VKRRDEVTAAARQGRGDDPGRAGPWSVTYLIVDIDIRDAAGLEEYRHQVPATLTKYGGRLIVRGGRFEKLEGNWQPKRLGLRSSPGVEQAKRRYDWRTTAR
jgi:uncharacterized protein (DUF1330 family)